MREVRDADGLGRYATGLRQVREVHLASWSYTCKHMHMCMRHINTTDVLAHALVRVLAHALALALALALAPVLALALGLTRAWFARDPDSSASISK